MSLLRLRKLKISLSNLGKFWFKFCPAESAGRNFKNCGEKKGSTTRGLWGMKDVGW